MASRLNRCCSFQVSPPSFGCPPHRLQSGGRAGAQKDQGRDSKSSPPRRGAPPPAAAAPPRKAAAGGRRKAMVGRAGAGRIGARSATTPTKVSRSFSPSSAKAKQIKAGRAAGRACSRMTARYRWSGGGGGRSVGTVVQPPGSRTHRSPLGGHGRNTWQEGGGLAALTPRGGDHTRRAALRLRCVGRARQEHLAGRRGVRRLTRRGEDHTGRAVRGIGARIIRFQAGATAAGSAAEQAPALAHGRLMGWTGGGEGP